MFRGRKPVLSANSRMHIFFVRGGGGSIEEGVRKAKLRSGGGAVEETKMEKKFFRSTLLLAGGQLIIFYVRALFDWPKTEL